MGTSPTGRHAVRIDRPDIFWPKGLPLPRSAVVTLGLEMINNLLRTGAILRFTRSTVLTLPAKHPFITKLPVELPRITGPVGILTLKNRALSPVAQLFINCAHELTKPLAKAKR